MALRTSSRPALDSGSSRGHTVDQRCLQGPNVLSLPALGALGDFELHALAFLQAAEASRLDGGEMHENIFAALPADKAIAFRVVKPLHCSLFHFVTFQIDFVRWSGVGNKTGRHKLVCKKLL